MLNKDLLHSSSIHKDVKKRAEFYFNSIGCGVGAYSESIGYKFGRQNVAKFL